MSNISIKYGNGDTELCLYSFLSLQCFILIPLVKSCQHIGLPTLFCYLTAIILPGLVYKVILKLVIYFDTLTPIRHPDDQGNHLHSATITLKVIVCSLVLGLIATVGLNYLLSHSKVQDHFVPLGFYLLLLSCFHFGEYFVTSLTNPSTLSLESFLLNNSRAYEFCILCSFVEYLLEAYLFVGFKKFNIISMLGLLLSIAGEFIRKLAMFTAGKSFTHMISPIKDPEHRLVTHGIYGLMRHPSYAGWFYWAIGTQVLLMNPICLALFYYASRVFFKDRIEYEEQLLLKFFKQDYKHYKEKVGHWMPIMM